MKANETQITNQLLIVTTRSVALKLTSDEIQIALNLMKEKMKVFDPLNPNLWTVYVGIYKLWGILDHGAGPEKEDVLTILFPEDY